MAALTVRSARYSANSSVMLLASPPAQVFPRSRAPRRAQPAPAGRLPHLWDHLPWLCDARLVSGWRAIAEMPLGRWWSCLGRDSSYQTGALNHAV